MFLLLVILIANVFYSVESQTTFTKSVFICADDYKVTSYTLDCQSGLYINVVRGIEIFARKNDGLPDCDSNGYVYNYSKPFQDYCNYKEVCILSTAFLNEKKLFDADTYFLTDDSLYLVPIRIEVYYQCLGSSSTSTTSSTTTASVSTSTSSYRTLITGSTSETTSKTTSSSSPSQSWSSSQLTSSVTTTTLITPPPFVLSSISTTSPYSSIPALFTTSSSSSSQLLSSLFPTTRQTTAFDLLNLFTPSNTNSGNSDFNLLNFFTTLSTTPKSTTTTFTFSPVEFTFPSTTTTTTTRTTTTSTTSTTTSTSNKMPSSTTTGPLPIYSVYIVPSYNYSMINITSNMNDLLTTYLTNKHVGDQLLNKLISGGATININNKSLGMFLNQMNGLTNSTSTSRSTFAPITLTTHSPPVVVSTLSTRSPALYYSSPSLSTHSANKLNQLLLLKKLAKLNKLNHKVNNTLTDLLKTNARQKSAFLHPNGTQKWLKSGVFSSSHRDYVTVGGSIYEDSFASFAFVNNSTKISTMNTITTNHKLMPTESNLKFNLNRNLAVATHDYPNTTTTTTETSSSSTTTELITTTEPSTTTTISTTTTTTQTTTTTESTTIKSTTVKIKGIKGNFSSSKTGGGNRKSMLKHKAATVLSSGSGNAKLDADVFANHLNPLRSKLKSLRDSTLNPVTSTQISSVSLTSATDRTVMIVLIVLGVIFFLIILAIIALICIRRRNQKKMQREFVYAADKVTHSPPQKVGGERSAGPNGRPFTEVNNTTPVKSAYGAGGVGAAGPAGVSETSGTYRARTNNAYDNSDNSMRSINNTYSMAGGGTNNLVTSGDYRNYRVDYDEYWKTNI